MKDQLTCFICGSTTDTIEMDIVGTTEGREEKRVTTDENGKRLAVCSRCFLNKILPKIGIDIEGVDEDDAKK